MTVLSYHFLDDVAHKKERTTAAPKQLILNHLPDMQMETFKAATFYLWIINQRPTGILPLLTPSLRHFMKLHEGTG